jgi:hypothetical protein
LEGLPPGLFSIPNNTQSSTVFDTPTGVLEFGFTKNSTPSLFGEFFQENLIATSRECREWSLRQRQQTSGVFPTAPVNPSTAWVVNVLLDKIRAAANMAGKSKPGIMIQSSSQKRNDEQRRKNLTACNR